MVLGRNKLSEEILTVGFCNGFRLVVKNIRKIIVIFLFGGSDFDEWQHKDS